MPLWVGSNLIFEMPPRKKSAPFGELGSTSSESWLSVSCQVAPPLRVSYRPTFAAPGGVKRPPLTDDEPCRATAVPTRMCLALAGSTATAATERSSVKSLPLAKVCTFLKLLAPSVDL